MGYLSCDLKLLDFFFLIKKYPTNGIMKLMCELVDLSRWQFTKLSEVACFLLPALVFQVWMAMLAATTIQISPAHRVARTFVMV